MLTYSQIHTLTTRADLLAEEAERVSDSGRTWRGRLEDLGDYGRAGGSAGDRRIIVEAMASLEREWTETIEQQLGTTTTEEGETDAGPNE